MNFVVGDRALDSPECSRHVPCMRSAGPPSIPLDQAVGFAPRVRIVCQCPRGVGMCGHSVIMRTEELYVAAPGAFTEKQFRDRLRCGRCKTRGWARIEAAGR